MNNETTYSQPTRNEIVRDLEEASQKYFDCDLVTFIQKLEGGFLPEDEDVVIGDMKAWLKFLPADDKIFRQAHRQLNVA